MKKTEDNITFLIAFAIAFLLFYEVIGSKLGSFRNKLQTQIKLKYIDQPNRQTYSHQAARHVGTLCIQAERKLGRESILTFFTKTTSHGTPGLHEGSIELTACPALLGLPGIASCSWLCVCTCCRG